MMPNTEQVEKNFFWISIIDYGWVGRQSEPQGETSQIMIPWYDDTCRLVWFGSDADKPPLLV